MKKICSNEKGVFGSIAAKAGYGRLEDCADQGNVSSVPAGPPIEDRIKALEVLTQRFPDIGWRICLAQFPTGHEVGEYSHRPRWRNDASGVGQPLTSGAEINQFRRKALDLSLAWPSHDEKTLGDLVANLHTMPEEHQETVWRLIEKWAATENDENRKAALRERIRRFAFLKQSAQRGVTSETKDRARKVYDLLMPTDVVTKHLWLFEQQWVEESFDELEDGDFDYRKREEKIRNSRIVALTEIWNARGFEGIKELLSKSGAAWTVGWHMADGVIPSSNAVGLIEDCLRLEDPGLQAKLDEAMRGFLHQIDAAVRSQITKTLAKILPPPLACRLLKCSPFEHDTWEHAGETIREQYWREVYPNWLRKESPDLNEAIDRLLDVRRPRAAFYAVHLALDEVGTSRLKRLLEEAGTSASEPAGTYRMDAQDISEALDALEKRVGVSEQEMASLEFLYVTVLEHTQHRIPNLEKQVGKSPALFVQALGLICCRDDGGEDPPEWNVKAGEQKSAIRTAAYQLLANFRRIPGTDDAGNVKEEELRAWVKAGQALCRQYGRAEVGDQKIGEMLSAASIGADRIWPCEPVRNVLEECANADVAAGFQVGTFNSRGAIWRGESGGQERALAEKYRNWSRQLRFDYPTVADIVEGIARDYDGQAAHEDSEAAVRRRLRH